MTNLHMLYPLFAIYFVAILYPILMLIRVELVYKAQMWAIDVASAYAREAIKRNKEWKPFHQISASYGSCESMEYQFNKWTKAQFYPDLEKKMQQMLDE